MKSSNVFFRAVCVCVMACSCEYCEVVFSLTHGDKLNRLHAY